MNVYRSENPSGPFSRLNDLALPAFGDARPRPATSTSTIRPPDAVLLPSRRIHQPRTRDRSHTVSGSSRGGADTPPLSLAQDHEPIAASRSTLPRNRSVLASALSRDRPCRLPGQMQTPSPCDR